MNINLSDFFKSNILTNNSDTTISAHSTTSSQNANNINTVLNTLLTGDTFTGFVNSVKDRNVNITMADGSTVLAKMAQGAQIAIGQNATFIVESTDNNKISIKPILANEQQSFMINKALEGAGLGATDKNINIVKELISQGMPLDSNTLNNMSKLSSRYPMADINTLANLTRLEIPVNENNITEFQAYKSFDGQIDSVLKDMSEGLIKDFSTISQNEDGKLLLSNVINELYSDLDGNTLDSSTIKDVFSKEETEALFNNLKEFIPEEELKDFENMSVKDTFGKILSNSNNEDKGDTSKLFESKEFKSLVKEMINDTLKLTPKNVTESEDAIKNYYKRIKKNIDHVDDMLKNKSDIAETAIQKSVSSIKNNIDFMNDLNKNMTYVQMPIKFSESEGNGELYVFTNKKNLKNNPDNISALLHLDMENLGPMDVFVKMTGNNVSTNFVLESEELLDFVYSNIDKLNERLEALGYKTHFEMKVASKEDSFDFVKSFIEKDVRTVTGGQYMLDIKA